MLFAILRDGRYSPLCTLLRNMLQLQRASGCDPPGDIKAETMMMQFVHILLNLYSEFLRHKISATLCNRHQFDVDIDVFLNL